MKASKKSPLGQWQKKALEPGVCAMCDKECKMLTVDHIIPIAIVQQLDETGKAIVEDEENFQLVCLPCNHLKGAKLHKRHPKTKQLLLKYLED